MVSAEIINAGPKNSFQKVWSVLIDGNNELISNDNPAFVRLTDGTNNSLINSLGELKVESEENRQLLTNVLKELKIMNLHLSILTDNQINKTEVE